MRDRLPPVPYLRPPVAGRCALCPACGASVTPAGAPVPEYTPRHLIADVLTSPGAVEGERKQVSVLFCDIVHSTALAQRLGPESFHDLLDRFFGIALEEVHRYQGTINQFLGDGFMALFGAPVAHEDHARQTVLAALAIHDAPSARKDELGEEIAVRIGINTGLVVVGKIGDDLRADYTAFGDTTVLAARLQAAAEPGEILISPDAVELLNGYFEFEPAEEVVVKERTVQGYRVLGLGPRRARIDDVEQLNLTPLVGRERELETLLELFADAIARLRTGRRHHGGTRRGEIAPRSRVPPAARQGCDLAHRDPVRPVRSRGSIPSDPRRGPHCRRNHG